MQSDEHIGRTREERRELALSLAQVVNSWHRGEPEESAEPAAPIHLNDKQLEIIKEWAVDDRLWTTQETVEFNLEVFARAIIAAIPKRQAPSPDPKCPTCGSDNKLEQRGFISPKDNLYHLCWDAWHGATPDPKA